MTLIPSFTRTVAGVLISLALVTALAAISEYWGTSHWSHGYVVSLAIPFLLVPAFVWFAFVPRRIELTENELIIFRLFGQAICIPLDELDYYMSGGEVFMIQPRGRSSAYQIFPGAFPRQNWRAFVQELETRYPERKASYYIGATLYGRRKI
jgi:hypothetical protein